MYLPSLYPQFIMFWILRRTRLTSAAAFFNTINNNTQSSNNATGKPVLYCSKHSSSRISSEIPFRILLICNFLFFLCYLLNWFLLTTWYCLRRPIFQTTYGPLQIIMGNRVKRRANHAVIYVLKQNSLCIFSCRLFIFML